MKVKLSNPILNVYDFFTDKITNKIKNSPTTIAEITNSIKVRNNIIQSKLTSYTK